MLRNFVRNLLWALGYDIQRKPAFGYRTLDRIRPGHLTEFESDLWFHDLYERAQKKTSMDATDNQLRRQRHYTLNYLLHNALYQVEGDVCEVGCWRGLSTYQIACRVKESGISKSVHVFDSFEGLSEFGPEDLENNENLDIDSLRSQLSYPLSAVAANLSEFEFIKYYPGWVPQKFPEVLGREFCFVHVDVDLYQPIKDSFMFFYPLLAPGGIMVFDDYGVSSFPGAKKAVDEVLSTIDQPMFMPLPSGQAFLLKNKR